MPAPQSRGTRARVLLVLINLLSFGCLVWTLRDAKLGELRDDLATMDWKWVAVAVVADIVVYFLQGVRWSLLLRPVEPVGFWQPVRAIYIGLFANEVLPFRAGEVLRCYLLSTWTELPFSVSLSSFVIERIFDGIWLTLGLLLTLRLVPLPRQFRYLVDGGWVLGLIVFALWAARGERVAGLPALGFAAIVGAAGPVVYALARAVSQAPSKAA